MNSSSGDIMIIHEISEDCIEGDKKNFPDSILSDNYSKILIIPGPCNLNDVKQNDNMTNTNIFMKNSTCSNETKNFTQIRVPNWLVEGYDRVEINDAVRIIRDWSIRSPDTFTKYKHLMETNMNESNLLNLNENLSNVKEWNDDYRSIKCHENFKSSRYEKDDCALKEIFCKENNALEQCHNKEKKVGTSELTNCDEMNNCSLVDICNSVPSNVCSFLKTNKKKIKMRGVNKITHITTLFDEQCAVTDFPCLSNSLIWDSKNTPSNVSLRDNCCFRVTNQLIDLYNNADSNINNINNREYSYAASVTKYNNNLPYECSSGSRQCYKFTNDKMVKNIDNNKVETTSKATSTTDTNICNDKNISGCSRSTSTSFLAKILQKLKRCDAQTNTNIGMQINTDNENQMCENDHYMNKRKFQPNDLVYQGCQTDISMPTVVDCHALTAKMNSYTNPLSCIKKKFEDLNRVNIRSNINISNNSHIQTNMNNKTNSNSPINYKNAIKYEDCNCGYINSSQWNKPKINDYNNNCCLIDFNTNKLMFHQTCEPIILHNQCQQSNSPCTKCCASKSHRNGMGQTESCYSRRCNCFCVKRNSKYLAGSLCYETQAQLHNQLNTLNDQRMQHTHSQCCLFSTKKSFKTCENNGHF